MTNEEWDLSFSRLVQQDLGSARKAAAKWVSRACLGAGDPDAYGDVSKLSGADLTNAASSARVDALASPHYIRHIARSQVDAAAVNLAAIRTRLEEAGLPVPPSLADVQGGLSKLFEEIGPPSSPTHEIPSR